MRLCCESSHDRVATCEGVFVAKPFQNSLRRVPLLPGPDPVILRDPVDHTGVRIEPGAGRWQAPPVSRGQRRTSTLAHRVLVQPEDTRRLADAHPFDVASTPDAQVELHSVHTSRPSFRALNVVCEERLMAHFWTATNGLHQPSQGYIFTPPLTPTPESRFLPPGQ